MEKIDTLIRRALLPGLLIVCVGLRVALTWEREATHGSPSVPSAAPPAIEAPAAAPAAPATPAAATVQPPADASSGPSAKRPPKTDRKPPPSKGGIDIGRLREYRVPPVMRPPPQIVYAPPIIQPQIQYAPQPIPPAVRYEPRAPVTVMDLPIELEDGLHLFASAGSVRVYSWGGDKPVLHLRAECGEIKEVKANSRWFRSGPSFHIRLRSGRNDNYKVKSNQQIDAVRAAVARTCPAIE